MVVIISASIHEVRFNGSVSEGVIWNLTNGAPTFSNEMGQITTVFASTKKSDWTITAGRGLLVNCPCRSAIDTTSPRRIVGLIEDTDGLDAVYRPGSLFSSVDRPTLPSRLFGKTGGAGVRHPYLNRPETALAQRLPMPLNTVP
jgi:hypothetical protein